LFAELEPEMMTKMATTQQNTENKKTNTKSQTKEEKKPKIEVDEKFAKEVLGDAASSDYKAFKAALKDQGKEFQAKVNKVRENTNNFLDNSPTWWRHTKRWTGRAVVATLVVLVGRQELNARRA